MALPWPQRVELVLFAAAFLCGAVAAAALTRTQVRRRGRGERGAGPPRLRETAALRAGPPRARRAPACGGRASALTAFHGSVRPGHTSVITSPKGHVFWSGLQHQTKPSLVAPAA